MSAPMRVVVFEGSEQDENQTPYHLGAWRGWEFKDVLMQVERCIRGGRWVEGLRDGVE